MKFYDFSNYYSANQKTQSRERDAKVGVLSLQLFKRFLSPSFIFECNANMKTSS